MRIHVSPAARQREEPVGLPHCFLKENIITTFSFAPEQTRFITASPTCLGVPEVCHCLAGSDLGAVARQTPRAQTWFLSHICCFGGAPLAVLGLHRAGIRAWGGGWMDRLCPWGGGHSPSALLWDQPRAGAFVTPFTALG